MAQPEFERKVAFHDEFALRYDEHLTRNPYDILARQAFVDLVTRHVPAGGTLLDFGCGTGLDALDYTRRGYRVLAYDNSPGMVAQLERRCEAEIASGEVTPYVMDYSSFLDRFPQWPAPQAVVANFAVLNLIRDVEPLFDTFRRNLAPPGWIFISILNPLHWSKLRMPAWWRHVLGARGGPPVFLSQPYTTYLHFVPALIRSAPGFRLVGRANAGKCVRYDPATRGAGQRSWWGLSDSSLTQFTRMLWQTAAHRLLGHFVFVVLQRDL